MNTKEAAEKWGCGTDEVRGWCRSGYINGATKEKGRWVIPQNAKRPIDRKMQREILWRILEVQNGERRVVQLTEWGIPDIDLPGSIGSLFDLCLRVREGATKEELSGWGDVCITGMGMRLLGRKNNCMDNLDAVPKVLTWTVSLAGTFAASFAWGLAENAVVVTQ